MITIFNRMAIIQTFDATKQSAIKDILSKNKIKYFTKVHNRNSASPFGFGEMRSRTGTLGEKSTLAYEYTVYINKKDSSKAEEALKDFNFSGSR